MYTTVLAVRRVVCTILYDYPMYRDRTREKKCTCDGNAEVAHSVCHSLHEQ